MVSKILSYESNAWMAVATYHDFYQPKKSYEEILQEETGFIFKSKDFTQSQAEAFAKRYRVDYQYSDDITGFGATLFWDTKLNKHIIAIRGTQPNTFKDILNDVFLCVTGIAYEQQVSLEAFYKRISTPVSEGGLGLIKKDEKIDVTGHSLGGFLTQIFVSLHENIVDHAYTYNSPGLGGIWKNIQSMFQTNIYPHNKITNITARDGLSFISDLGNDKGSFVAEFPGSSHSGVDLANVISFYSIFTPLNDKLTVSEIVKFYDNYPLENENIKNLLTFFQMETTGVLEDDILNIKNYINTQTKGIKKLEGLSYKIIDMFEENKEEKQKNIQTIIDNVKHQPTIDLKLQTLQNSSFLSNFEDKYCQELIKQYHDKVIENRCNAVSNLDFLNMDITYDFSSMQKETSLKENTNEEKEEYSFSYQNQNNQTVQMIN